MEHQARYEFAASYVPGKVVIDCACGTGIGFERFMAAGARRMLGFDSSIEAVAASRKRLGDAVEIAVADAVALPVPDATAELFISLETIEHIYADGRFLDEVARVLAPNGIFICSTPNRTVSNPGLGPQNRPANRFHVREYGTSEFSALLAPRFLSFELRGQNPIHTSIARSLEVAGRVLPFRMVTRARQAAKIRYLLPQLRREHRVQEMRPRRDYEYLVAVCSSPVRSS
jgi:ubiquinone/menaquinone biosynthesis C-methylase UbiE